MKGSELQQHSGILSAYVIGSAGGALLIGMLFCQPQREAPAYGEPDHNKLKSPWMMSASSQAQRIVETIGFGIV